MVYNYLTINVTDTIQDVVTYYTITDLSPLMIFNFTVYITNSHVNNIDNQVNVYEEISHYANIILTQTSIFIPNDLPKTSPTTTPTTT